MPNGIFSLKQQVLAIREGGWPGLKPLAVDYLVVAGGGGGAGNTSFGSGGGGGGGLLQGNLGVTAGSAITVTIGAGGAGGAAGGGERGTTGNSSVFGAISTSGGGGGGAQSAIQAGLSGGSGGGGGQSNGTGGQGTSGQGNAGGNGNTDNATYTSGGGGGGAGTVGLNGSSAAAGNGGAGAASDISGTRTTYAGGGGGASDTKTAGSGGAGGGGAGGGTAGTANTGGGGGGKVGSASGGTGGSGIVIVSYPDIYAAAASTTGSPTVSTSGSGSISNSGSNNQGWSYAGQTGFVFGTGDFTVEFWIYFNSLTGFPTIYDCRATDGSGNGPVIYYNTGVGIAYSSGGSDRITGSALSTGQWYHIALTRSGTSTRMFLNGTQTGSTYSDSTNYVCAATAPRVMINAAGNAGSLNGYITNLRVVKGTAVYTANFSTPTAPLTAISGTSLLLSAVSGAYFADSSTNAFTPTIIGTGGASVWNSASPFATGLGYKNRVYTWTSSGSITF